MSNMATDPVCGMTVAEGQGLSENYAGRQYRFCSEYCHRQFLADPQRYFQAPAALASHTVQRRIAYFSMEAAVEPHISTYSGGLGVLAGDTLHSAADLRVPAVGVTLLAAKGYFAQELDEIGNQHEQPAPWDCSAFTRERAERVQVSIEGRPVVIRAWQFDIKGVSGHEIPLFLLDTDVEDNRAEDRELTWRLYGGDARYRLAQEIVLGVGGVRMLRALGYDQIERYHMNEGHAALLTLELLREHIASGGGGSDFDGTRSHCVFTTHTPVPAGHDQFDYGLADRVLGDLVSPEVLRMLGGADHLNMTHLALHLSRYVNGVAQRHGEVSQRMFPGEPIDFITNGVHSATWTCESFAQLYDHYIPGWRNHPSALRHAINLPGPDVWAAHASAKAQLIKEIHRRAGIAFSEDLLTIGFARRATQYKRADLVFHDPERLAEIARSSGQLQLVFAGKAHPRDEAGKEAIRRVFAAAHRLADEVAVVYLADYDLHLAKLLASGVDLWLNTPKRPLEASGTSGMKAAHNGVPSLSILDGWWLEGHIEGITGWSIGPATADAGADDDVDARDADDLYTKLGGAIVPLYYQNRDRWIDVMRHAIAVNASYFNTHRMVQQYVTNAYL